MSTQSQELSPAGKLTVLGVLLLVAGIGSALYFAFGFDPSVSSVEGSVVNLQLEQDRLLGFLASLVGALAGLLIILAAWLASKLDHP